jgi:hypothetical protein
MLFTVMPRGARSSAAPLTQPATAVFVSWYTLAPAKPVRTSTLLPMVVTRTPPRSCGTLGLDGQEHTAHVDGQHLVQLSQRHRVDGAAPVDAGVDHHDLQGAEARHGLGDGAADGICNLAVGRDGVCLAAGLLDLRSQRLGLVGPRHVGERVNATARPSAARRCTAAAQMPPEAPNTRAAWRGVVVGSVQFSFGTIKSMTDNTPAGMRGKETPSRRAAP